MLYLKIRITILLRQGKGMSAAECLLIPEIRELIILHLRYVDLRDLGMVCRSTRNPPGTIERYVRHGLELLGHDPDQFLRRFAKETISGSFMVWVLTELTLVTRTIWLMTHIPGEGAIKIKWDTDVGWVPGDIDVLSYQNVHSLSGGIDYQAGSFGCLEGILEEEYTYSNSESYSPFGDLVRYYRNQDGHSLNHIPCLMDPLDAIGHYYDTNICKIAYQHESRTGDKFSPRLRVWNWHNLRERKALIIQNPIMDGILIFQQFSGDSETGEMDEYFRAAQGRLEYRQMKYQSRGFLLTRVQHPPLNPWEVERNRSHKHEIRILENPKFRLSQYLEPCEYP